MKLYKESLLSTVIATALFSQVVLAQEEAKKESIIAIETIEITAMTRKFSLQETPISITAVTSDQLEKTNTEMFDDITSTIPNVQFNNTSEMTNNKLTIRGIGNFQQSPSVDPADALYVDGVFMGSDMGSQISFFDVERIEVLRGPQGTLFGRNSIGGAINVITADPLEYFYAKARVTAGNYNTLRLEGVLNCNGLLILTNQYKRVCLLVMNIT